MCVAQALATPSSERDWEGVTVQATQKRRNLGYREGPWALVLGLLLQLLFFCLFPFWATPDCVFRAGLFLALK